MIFGGRMFFGLFEIWFDADQLKGLVADLLILKSRLANANFYKPLKDSAQVVRKRTEVRFVTEGYGKWPRLANATTHMRKWKLGRYADKPGLEGPEHKILQWSHDLRHAASSFAGGGYLSTKDGWKKTMVMGVSKGGKRGLGRVGLWLQEGWQPFRLSTRIQMGSLLAARHAGTGKVPPRPIYDMEQDADEILGVFEKWANKNLKL